MVSSLLARVIMVTIGTLYPGYQSYKSLKNEDLKEIYKCIRYWIVFSVFIACETIADIFLSWFPFYYWLKIAFVFWMVSPTGSKYLYKRLIRPFLKDREQEIDEMIQQFKQRGCTALASLTNRGVRYASTLFVDSAIFGQEYLRNHLKRSLSVSDIDNLPKGASPKRSPIVEEAEEETDGEFTRITDEEIKRAPKLKSERHSVSNSQRKAAILPGLTNATSTKKTSAAYSSSESAHLGTISKRSGHKRREAVMESQSQSELDPTEKQDPINRK